MWVREGLVEKVTFKLIDDCREGTKFCKELGGWGEGKRAFQAVGTANAEAQRWEQV